MLYVSRCLWRSHVRTPHNVSCAKPLRAVVQGAKMVMSLSRENSSRYRNKTLPLTLTSGHFLQVNRDIVSGLKYVQHTYRTGVKGKRPLCAAQ